MNRSERERGVPPSIHQAHTLASPQVESALTGNATILTALGVDWVKLAADTTATAEAGERTLRLFESAFRSMLDYHARAKAIAPEVTSLSAALRKLDPTSPLATAFAPVLPERSAARGTAAAKRTTRRRARVKAKAAAAPAATPRPNPERRPRLSEGPRAPQACDRGRCGAPRASLPDPFRAAGRRN